MARIRHIAITNFRCIQSLSWYPSDGINCLIGPGDSGKSSILDAIDYCLGARRSISFTDADFYRLQVDQPIVVEITMGELNDSLKSLESYGHYLRGYDQLLGVIEDEPAAQAETVLTIRMTVGSDLDPVWTLVSDRAEAQGQARFLTWSDRARLSPTRIGALADHNLAWRRGSVLNKLSDERADTSAALAKAGRDARHAFGDLAEEQLGETLQIVTDTAKELGILVGDKLKAMLDAHSVSFTGGTIALHGSDGVPLRALGMGSTRLLVAGLQRRAAKEATVILIDELECGLEPHRIIRLLGSIGAKEAAPPLQAFVTTHSPVALRELNGAQLMVVRKRDEVHRVDALGDDDGIQATVRLYPEAFLAPSVIVCEGASEVGLMRGLDAHAVASGSTSLMALGIALVDAAGCDKIYKRATALNALNYRTAVLRDDDRQPDPAVEAAFTAGGGALFHWRPGRSLESELFASLSNAAIIQLLERAVELHGEELIEAHISSESLGLTTLAECRAGVNADVRATLARASQTKKSGWFKSVGWMEDVARDIVGPDLPNADPDFVAIIRSIGAWANNA